MKIIIDSYRGGNDTGDLINGEYEKNILLNISKLLQKELINNNVKSILTREIDISLNDDERSSIINEIKDKSDIIIQNRLSEDNQFNIIYPLRTDDKLSSYISNNLNKNNITVDNYYQRRLPTNTILDYYSLLRNTNPNEALIIEYPREKKYDQITKILAKSIEEYLNNKITYIVKKGDTLYQIAKTYQTTVDEIKKLNNLPSNNLSINQKILIPSPPQEENYKTYIVKKGDTLYQIAKAYQTTVDEIKKLNNLPSNNLSINQKILIPK